MVVTQEGTEALQGVQLVWAAPEEGAEVLVSRICCFRLGVAVVAHRDYLRKDWDCSTETECTDSLGGCPEVPVLEEGEGRRPGVSEVKNEDLGSCESLASRGSHQGHQGREVHGLMDHQASLGCREIWDQASFSREGRLHMLQGWR